jgi:hypothetical protein
MHDDDLLLNRPVELRRPEAAAAARETAHGPTAGMRDLQQQAGNRGVVQLIAAQRAAGATVQEEGAEGPSVHDVVGRGGGQPLDDTTRVDMETSLGHDFSDVRVHTDSTADASAKGIGANAYTVGNEVVFGAGHFAPGSSSGRETLAHELTHVVQQRSGPVDGTDIGGGVAVSDPSDRFEQAAEAAAAKVSSGETGVVGLDGVSSAPATASAQRETAPGEEELPDEVAQGQFAQREPTPGEEELPEGQP